MLSVKVAAGQPLTDLAPVNGRRALGGVCGFDGRVLVRMSPTDTEAGQAPAPTSARVVWPVLVLAICVVTWGSLLSFDAGDWPSPNQYPHNDPPANACGPLGAIVATTVFQSVGLAGWLAVVFLVGLDLSLFRRRQLVDLPWRAAGVVLAMLGTATLLALFLPDAVPRPVWGPGGALGVMASHVAREYLAPTGAAIVALALVGTGMFLASDQLVLRLLGGFVSLLSTLGDAGLAVGRGLWNLRRAAAADAAEVEEAEADQTWWQRRRAARLAAAAEADADEDADEEEDDGPTIRVRRRTPVVESSRQWPRCARRAQ